MSASCLPVFAHARHAGPPPDAAADAFVASAPVAGKSAPPRASGILKDGIQRIRRAVDADLALQKTPRPDGLRLRPNAESIFLPQKGPTARGTVVMLHGYTAAPWQYKEMAERFHDAGYNVYVPRMPGHGLEDAAGTPTGKDIPDSNERYRWEAFIDTTFDDAAALGAPVYAVGLSGGANVALRAAEKRTDLAGIVAMSPYIGGNYPKGLIFPVFNFIDAVTLGAFGKLLDHRPYHQNVKAPNDPHPHTQGTLGQAMGMEQLGSEVKHINCRAQFLTTDGDLLSGSKPVASLIHRATDAQPTAWYRFPKSEGVPHAMLSPIENKAPGAAQHVSDIAFDFIGTGKASNRQ
jgi:carboxylesterase